MVIAQIRTNAHRVFDRITVPITRNGMAKWFTNDIDIVCTGDFGVTIIADFNFSASSIIEVTLDGTTWAAINGGVALAGRQSIYQRVLNGDKLNYRAQANGLINRIVVGEV